ncbi:AraC family transcriptional regulator [Pseudorhodoferax soli]|uniref:AraC-like DNA-binding protein n=1 Tax=Pseudorhodoferax soli TaxID=545864 RepID=A0A368X8U3_9BURK|nr:AraC family transcriptional regulator [Pseudorhodoferax soli]RCW63626.1 AraC-like DNA-binding protein [Pseudorhodoferax soli]
MAFIRAIVLAYAKAGKDATHALRSGGLVRSQVDDPMARVTAEQMESICHFAMRELDDEALGWFSRTLPWGTNGMLCRAALPSPTLGVALKRWCRHHGLMVDAIAMRISVRNALVTVEVEERKDLGEQREFALVSMLRSVHGVACWLVDSRIALRSAAFPYPPPEHSAAYSCMFGAGLCFDEKQASIRFDAHCLGMRVVRDDADLRQMLKRPLPLLVHQYPRVRLVGRQVRNLLRAHTSKSLAASDLASKLNLSVRSLHRHLAEEGFSLQAIKNDVRRDAAIASLAHNGRPLKQVAGSVGFQNEASFNRAFREWTGQTPTAYRRGLDGTAAAGGRLAHGRLAEATRLSN